MSMAGKFVYDEMLFSLCQRRLLKAEVVKRMGMTGLRWSSVRLLIRMMEAGGRGFVAHLGNDGEFIAARRECVERGLLVERMVRNEGVLGRTHPHVKEMELTGKGRALAGPGLLYLKRLAARVNAEKLKI